MTYVEATGEVGRKIRNYMAKCQTFGLSRSSNSGSATSSCDGNIQAEEFGKQPATVSAFPEVVQTSLQKYSFKRTLGFYKQPWSELPAVPQKYSADESTGECKAR